MPDTFWPTIAQVSATFAGLVFVGFSIYLGNVSQAMNEVKQALPQAEESIMGLIHVSVWTNLLFYWLPLLLALTYIVGQPVAQIGFVFFLLFFAIALSFVYRLERVTKQMDCLRLSLTNALRVEIASPRKQMWWRIRIGKLVIAFAFLTGGGLYLASLFSFLPSAEELLKHWAMLGLVAGSLFSLIDLAIFRLDNIFFSNLDQLLDRMKEQEHRIRDRMAKVSSDFEELGRLLNDQPNGFRAVYSPYYERLQQSFNLLSREIPSDQPHLRLVQEFFTLGPIISFSEMRDYNAALSELEAGVDDFSSRLEKLRNALQKQRI